MIKYRDQSEIVTVADYPHGDKVKSQVVEYLNHETSDGEIKPVALLVVYTWIVKPDNSITHLQVTTIKQ